MPVEIDAMKSPFDLSGKVAIVTGANTGIGQGLAVGLAQAGANIAAVGRTTPTAVSYTHLTLPTIYSV